MGQGPVLSSSAAAMTGIMVEPRFCVKSDGLKKECKFPLICVEIDGVQESFVKIRLRDT